MQPAEIGNLGERYVVEDLQTKGFACYHNTQGAGATDIEGRGNPTSVLVQVKTAMHPYDPETLSAQEQQAICARATRKNCQAWLAQVKVSTSRALMRPIRWTQLA